VTARQAGVTLAACAVINAALAGYWFHRGGIAEPIAYGLIATMMVGEAWARLRRRRP
jgi:hypothetical protein